MLGRATKFLGTCRASIVRRAPLRTSASDAQPVASSNPQAVVPPPMTPPVAPPKPRRRKGRYFLAVAGPALVYYLVQRHYRKEALEQVKYIVSPDENEVKDLLWRSELSGVDIDRIRAHVQKSVPSGWAELEKLGQLLATAVANKWTIVKKEAEAAREQRRQREKARLLQELKDKAAREAQGIELTAEQQKAEEAERQKREEENADLDQELEWDEKRLKFAAWDVLCLLRNAPVDQQKQIPVTEFLTAIALLAIDQKPEHDRLVDPTLSAEELRSRNRDPYTKLLRAWRVFDTDNDGKLNYGELVQLCGALARTGHLTAESLVRLHSLWPSDMEVCTPEALANHLYSDLGKAEPLRAQSAHPPASSFLEQQQRYAAEALQGIYKPLVGTAVLVDKKETVTWDEFRQVIASLTTVKDVEAWYTVDQFTGFFKNLREKNTERALRLINSFKRGHPVHVEPQEGCATLMQTIPVVAE